MKSIIKATCPKCKKVLDEWITPNIEEDKRLYLCTDDGQGIIIQVIK